VRTLLKILLLVVGVLVVLMSAVLVRSTATGMIVWYISVPSTSIQTDGKPSAAWLHREAKGLEMILTRNVN
jgi:hypothetical protein